MEYIVYDGVEAVKQLCRDEGLPSFHTLNVPEENFDRIAEMSARNISTGSNPRPMDKQDYLNVLQLANEAE